MASISARSSTSGLLEQTTVVKDQDEALDFLHARGSFRRRPSGLPAVVVLGPNLQKTSAFSLLQDIRTDETLCRLPVVMIADEPEVDAGYPGAAAAMLGAFAVDLGRACWVVVALEERPLALDSSTLSHALILSRNPLAPYFAPYSTLAGASAGY